MARALVTVRVIDAIVAIPDADNIECALVGGWPVVVKKGEFKPGDRAVYFEVDSFVPKAVAPSLTKPIKQADGSELPGTPSKYQGANGIIEGERLRTIRCRKQLSQGLLLPMTILDPFQPLALDADLAVVLGVEKYERPEEEEGVRGPPNRVKAPSNFPPFIPKTDQERIQNFTGPAALGRWLNNPQFKFERTEKLDGSSATYFIKNGEVGVCSRNVHLTYEPTNNFWKTGLAQGILTLIPPPEPTIIVDLRVNGKLITDKDTIVMLLGKGDAWLVAHTGVAAPQVIRNTLIAYYNAIMAATIPLVYDLPTFTMAIHDEQMPNFALQGEIVGPGIQNNRYNLKTLTFYLFEVYDIDQQRYLLPDARRAFAQRHNLLHVPVLEPEEILTLPVADLLKREDGKSVLYAGAWREGSVYKCSDQDLSFKAISNHFLLKHEA